MSNRAERTLAEMQLRQVGGQDLSPAELIAEAQQAGRSLQSRAERAAARARRLREAGDLESALLAYRQYATLCWHLGQQWTRSVWCAFGGAAECALQLGRRAQAGRFLKVADMDDGDIIAARHGVRALLLLRHRDELEAVAPKTRTRRSPRGGRRRTRR